MVAISIRRPQPVTLDEWSARFDLAKLQLVRVVDGGTVAHCPKCHAVATESRIYQDGHYLRVFARCGCGHVFERLGQS